MVKGNVVRLDKSIYGLKQAPRIWYEILCASLKELGFVPMTVDASSWVKNDGHDIIYLIDVVDDIYVLIGWLP
jgi:hypothetical protein